MIYRLSKMKMKIKQTPVELLRAKIGNRHYQYYDQEQLMWVEVILQLFHYAGTLSLLHTQEASR